MKDKKMEFFCIDSMVEVRSKEEGFNGAWYTAKILKSIQGGTCLVEYQSDSSNPPFTELVDISSIRPLPPPPAADQSYEPLDVVDAFHCDGWWKGVVTKVEVLEDKNTVVFENPPQQFDFRSRDLRFHLVWTDGEWVPSPKPKRMEGLKIGKGMDVEVNFDGGNLQDAWFPAIVVEEVGFNSFLVEFGTSRNDGEDGHMKETVVDSFHIRPIPPKLEVQNFEIFKCVEAFHGSCWKKGTIFGTSAQGRYNVLLHSEKGEIQFRKSDLRPYLLWTNGEWEIPNGTQREEQSVDVGSVAKHSEVVLSLNSSSTVQDHCCKKMRNTMDHAEENTSVKKSRKSPLDIQNERKKQRNGSDGNANKMDFEDCARREAELSTIKNMEIGDVMIRTSSIVPVADHTLKAGASCDAVNDDRALSTCFESDQEGNVESFTQSCETIVQVDNEIMKKQEMPFTKSSSFWQYVDSQDIFQFLPQKPHFRPLFECNELTREGLAIGHMVNFATLVENIAKLQATEPKKVFDSYLEALADLEMLGFDVKAVVDRINKLFSIKTRQEQLHNQSKETHSKIAQCDGEKAKLEEEINAIEEMISELAAKRAVKVSEKAMIDSESNRLRMDANRIDEDISNPELDFESQAAAPW